MQKRCEARVGVPKMPWQELSKLAEHLWFSRYTPVNMIELFRRTLRECLIMLTCAL